MGTRAVIKFYEITKDGKRKDSGSILKWCDGYPEVTGELLTKYVSLYASIETMELKSNVKDFSDLIERVKRKFKKSEGEDVEFNVHPDFADYIYYVECFNNIKLLLRVFNTHNYQEIEMTLS